MNQTIKVKATLKFTIEARNTDEAREFAMKAFKEIHPDLDGEIVEVEENPVENTTIQ